MTDRNTLLRSIGEVSFMLDDLRLYLDTHPLDEDAMNIYGEYSARRKQLLKEYADQFEPLTAACICPESNGGNSAITEYPGRKHWTWNDGPAPWETSANAFAAQAAPVKGGI